MQRTSQSSLWLCALLALLFATAHVYAAAPTISGIANQTIDEGQSTAVLNFTIGDAEDSPSQLVVTRASSNTNLVALSGIVLGGGNDASRTVQVTPLAGASGTVTITLTVTDSTNETASASFTVTVNHVNDPPTISTIANRTINEDANTGAISFTVGDDETPATQLSVTGSSSNTQLVPNSAIVISSGGANRTVTVTPATNQNGQSTITLTVSDGTNTVTESFTLTVSAQPDSPAVSGTFAAPASSPLRDNQAGTRVFSNIAFADPDHLRPNSESVTVTVSITDGGLGDFNPESATYSGTPAQVTAAISNIVFTPTPNVLAPGQTGTVSITFTVVDDTSRSATLSGTLYIVGENDAPTLTVDLAPAASSDTADVSPFLVEIADADPGDSTATFTLTIQQTSGTNFGRLDPANPSLTGTIAAIEAAVRNVFFRPVRNSVAGSTNVSFQVTVTDPRGAATNRTAVLTLTGLNDAPSISGASATTFRISDDPGQPPLYPFQSIQINDPDENGQQILTIALSVVSPAVGTLSQTGFVGRADVVTPLVRSVFFTPLQRTNRVVGETINASLVITATDSLHASTSDDNTRLAITSVNGAPQILGVPTVQPLLVAPTPPVRPFRSLAVTDDSTAPITVTIALDNPAKGSLTNLGGFAQVSPGLYRIVTNYSAATAALTNLEYRVSSSYLFPPSEPGGTTFTIEATDAVLNSSTKTLSILIQFEPRNRFVTKVEDDGTPGTLRHAVTNAANNDTITFALPSYPAVIRLNAARGPLPFSRNLTLKGPGAQLLTISGDSNGDLSPDTQILRVSANATIEGVTLSRGGGSTSSGGAVYVAQGGRLLLRSSTISHSRAEQWGGAIDVDGGALEVDSCFFFANATDSVLGLGGGAISLYTELPCSFINTTFARNQQSGPGGYGGGALYAENVDPDTELPVTIDHCTFAENTDVAGLGSSIMANVFGTAVRVRDSIFADASGGNLEVAGAGNIISLGGNLSDDATHTTLSQGGQPQLIALLNQSSDLVNTDPQFVVGQSCCSASHYALAQSSPARGRAVGTRLTLDARGVLRDNDPDSGALEADAAQRVVLNEIHFASTTQSDFIELYIPRDSTPVDLSGYILSVNGTNKHVFSNTVIQPGFGVILAGSSITAAGTRVDVVPGLDLPSAGLVEIKPPGISNSPIVSAIYNGVFIDPANGTNTLALPGNSITLAPQFAGFAYLPHCFVLPPPTGGANLSRPINANLTSPGQDTSPTPFGARNAAPIAVQDRVIVDEDRLSELPALANDFDADGLDQLIIIGLSTTPNPATGGDLFALSALGAQVDVISNRVFYSARYSDAIQRLPSGAEATDSVFYQVIDYGTGPIAGYTPHPSPLTPHTVISSPGHRLETGDQIRIRGAATAAYNNQFAVTRIDDDRFSVPVTFSTDESPRGSWITTSPRNPTQRSETNILLTVIGANDLPVAGPDFLTTDEESVLRVLADTNLLGSTAAFPTDGTYPHKPQLTSTALLRNDYDVDTDDTFRTLNVIGVVSTVNTISGYAPHPSPLTPHSVAVTSPAHGLISGTTVTLSGYAGDRSYNRAHVVTVLDADRFTIPVPFQDNDPITGHWAILNDANRLSATSHFGAQVTLELRANRAETSLTYNPRGSAYLNGLGISASGVPDLADDSFYYAIQDSHGAISFGRVTVQVRGVNDTPVAGTDPAGLGALLTLGGGQSLPQIVTQINVRYFLPGTSADHVDLLGTFAGTDFTLANAWFTDENTALSIAETNLLSNDSDVDRIDTLHISALANSTYGAQLSLAGGIVTYNPAASARLNSLAREETVVDLFPITVSDPRGSNVTTYVAVVVTGVNDTPIAQNDVTETAEDLALVLSPLRFPEANPAAHDYDVDINGSAPDNVLNVVTVTNATSGAGASFQIVSNLLTYDPSVSAFLNGLAAGQSHPDVIPYTITDSSMVFANDDLFLVSADSTSVQLNVLANDANLHSSLVGQSCCSAASLTVISASAPDQGGSVQISADGKSIIYTPEVNFVGDELFTYTVIDELGNRDTALVRVRPTITHLNGALVASADSFSIARGESALLNILANDGILATLSSPAVPLTITRIVSQPANDLVTITNNQVRFTQTGSGPFPYSASFSYEISGGGTARSIATVTVQVINRQGSLNVRDDSFSIVSGAAEALLDVLANDEILPGSGSDLRLSGVTTAPAHGTVQINPAATAFLYTAAPGFIGVDSFAYLVTDGVGGTGTGVVRVAVGQLTTAPDFFAVRFDDPASTDDDGPTELNVLANDSVLQNAPEMLVITAVSRVNTNAPSLGTISINSNGSRLLFDPAPNQLGEQEFIYTVSDSSANTAQGRLTIAVTRDAVSANPDYVSVLLDSTGNSLDVLGNDASSNPARSLTLVSIGTGPDAPNHGGTVVINPVNNRLLYTPAPGFVGEESFTYTMTDAVDTDTARVVVKVTAGDLVGNADAFTVYFEQTGSTGQPRQFTLPVLLNDRVLPDLGQQLFVVGVGMDAVATNAPDHQGTVTVSPDAVTLLYVPNPANTNFPFTERFTYELSDGSARRAFAEVTVEVQQREGIHEIATADDAYSVQPGSELNILSVLQNDNIKPASASRWIITSVTVPSNGVALVDGPAILYTPQDGFVGTDEFTYSVSDGFGGTGSARVRVKVGHVHIAPDLFTVLSGSITNVLPVLANDAVLPTDGRVFRIAAVTSPAHGGAVVPNAEGTALLYTPDATRETNNPAGYPYAEQFAYDLVDDSGRLVRSSVTVHVFKSGSDRANGAVMVTVHGVNDAPVIAGAGVTPSITDKETTTPFAAVSVADVDNQGAERFTIRVRIDDAVKGSLTNHGAFTRDLDGTLTMQGTGAELTAALQSLTFVPVQNRIIVPQTENTVLTLVAQDLFASVTNTVTIPVKAANDAPTIAGTGPVRVYFRSTVKPFAGTRISDVDDSRLQPLYVTITLSDASHGYLTNLGEFVAVNATTYRRENVHAAAANAELQAMVFVPTPGTRVTPGTPETTRLTLAVDDRFAAIVTDTNTVVTAFEAPVSVTLAGDRQNSSRFGSAIASTRDYAVVGAWSDAANNVSGSAYILGRNRDGSETWTERFKLLPADGANADEFGTAVAISGDLVAVGSPRDDDRGTDSGSVYLFRRNAPAETWSFVRKFTAADGVAAANFGAALAFEGETLVVGAPGDTTRGNNAGVVYIFERNQGGSNTWGLVQKLNSTDAKAGDRFGTALAMDGSNLLVGSPTRDENGINGMGAAYLFTRSGATWTQAKKLTITPADAGDQVGSAVALSGDLIILGVSRKDTLGTDSGAVFLFERNFGGANQWGRIQRLTPTAGTAGDRFGISVGISGSRIAIGASGKNGTGADSGVAFIFERVPGTNQWFESQRLLPRGGSNKQFGYALAFRNHILHVGAPLDTDGSTTYGAVYSYNYKYDNVPVLIAPIADATATSGMPFTLNAGGMVFNDADIPESLAFTASLADGSPLPAWLSFSSTGTFSGTPMVSDVATHSIRVTATDSDGESISTTFTLRVAAAALAAWRAEWFGADANNPAMESTWGDAADPDQDGVSNYLEYLFGSNPLVADSAVTLSPSRNEAGQLTICWLQRTDDNGVTYVLESSTDLVAWTTASGATPSLAPLDGSFARATVVLGSNEANRFFRLKVMTSTSQN